MNHNFDCTINAVTNDISIDVNNDGIAYFAVNHMILISNLCA